MFYHSSVFTILNILYSEVDKCSTILAKNNFIFLENNFTPEQILYIHEIWNDNINYFSFLRSGDF